MNRKEFLRTTSLVGLGVSILGPSSCATSSSHVKNNPYNFINLEQTPLSYGFDGLEPKISKQIMEIHYNKHAAGYLKKLKSYLKENKVKEDNLYELMTGGIHDDFLRNNLGGHFNHEIFWRSMSPSSPMDKGLSKDFKKAIKSSFGSTEKFLDQLSQKAAGVFGSGWAWIVIEPNHKINIHSTANQNNPLMKEVGNFAYPLIGIDVWEHAYYLQYQNRRKDYISAWEDIINWEFASEMYEKTMSWIS